MAVDHPRAPTAYGTFCIHDCNRSPIVKVRHARITAIGIWRRQADLLFPLLVWIFRSIIRKRLMVHDTATPALWSHQLPAGTEGCMVLIAALNCRELIAGTVIVQGASQIASTLSSLRNGIPLILPNVRCANEASLSGRFVSGTALRSFADHYCGRQSGRYEAVVRAPSSTSFAAVADDETCAKGRTRRLPSSERDVLAAQIHAQRQGQRPRP